MALLAVGALAFRAAPIGGISGPALFGQALLAAASPAPTDTPVPLPTDTPTPAPPAPTDTPVPPTATPIPAPAPLQFVVNDNTGYLGQQVLITAVSGPDAEVQATLAWCNGTNQMFLARDPSQHAWAVDQVRDDGTGHFYVAVRWTNMPPSPLPAACGSGVSAGTLTVRETWNGQTVSGSVALPNLP